MQFDQFSVYMAMQKHIYELQAAADRTLCDMLADAVTRSDDKTLINRCAAYLFIRLTAMENAQLKELREYVSERLSEDSGYDKVLGIFDLDDIKDAMIG